MFYEFANDYLYSQPLTVPHDGNCYLPLEIDTEYTHPEYNINHPHKNICTNLTVQIRSVTIPTGMIYAHPENPTPRHPVYRHPCAAFDYLESQGHTVSLQRLPSLSKSTNHDWLQLDMYSYFAVAEIARVFQGEFLEDVLSLCTSTKGFGIEQTRRLRTYTRIGGKLFNWIQLPWLVCIDNKIFRLRLSIYDTSAIHGVANYATFCANSGVTLNFKDVFTTSDKGQMDIMYKDRPEDFDNYALGDLYNYDALLGNAENFKSVYQHLGIEKYYTPPRFTIGSTVARLVEGCIKKLFNSEVDDSKIISAFCKYATADYLKRKVTSTGCLNAKVDGGRCRNNRPIDTTARGVLADIDISGCYGEGLRIQTYPLGVPLLIDYPVDSNINKYQTLREFLKTYGSELVPGLWQARVSLYDGQLEHPQDYLASWFPPNDISKMATDEDYESTDQWWTVDNVGDIKILTHEINHAIITHDFIQWLDNIASEKQRIELLDCLIVETALFYPASERVDTIDELIENHANHQGENTTVAKVKKRRTAKIAVERECHSWYGINLGDLLITELLIERKKHPKNTPFNTLYKLCINTVYGDMVSPFFRIGNVVVGNNITARARALAWCMEKGLHGWQSITDGCVFDVNNILHPRRQRITGESVVDLYRQSRSDNHKLAPLGHTELSVTDNLKGYKLGVLDDKATLITMFGDGEYWQTPDQSLIFIDKMAMRHLQQLFPGLDVLHQITTDVNGNSRVGQFEFETKGLYDTACFHGTANYLLAFNGERRCAMRSYSKKGHKSIILNDALEVSEDKVRIGELFLTSLEQPKVINRSNVYLKERILKVADYSRNYRTYKDSLLYPGITVETPALLRELSLSQFTFRTYAQLKSWYREKEALTRKYGQSYEMFFANEDNTLNYQDMIVVLDKLIRTGKNNFFDGMDKRTQNIYRQFIPHVNKECLERCQEKILQRYYNDKCNGLLPLEQLEELDYYECD